MIKDIIRFIIKKDEQSAKALIIHAATFLKGKSLREIRDLIESLQKFRQAEAVEKQYEVTER